MAVKEGTQSKTTAKRSPGDPSAQDRFLADLVATRQAVNLFLINGVKLTGEIVAFDQFVILLNGSSQDHVYKRAVSTIQPASRTAPKTVDRHEPASSARTGAAKTPTIVRRAPRRVIDRSLL